MNLKHLPADSRPRKKLLHGSADALKTIKGLGPAKRAEVVAVLELARRALAQQMQDKAVRDDLQLQCEPSLDSNPNCAGVLA